MDLATGFSKYLNDTNATETVRTKDNNNFNSTFKLSLFTKIIIGM